MKKLTKSQVKALIKKEKAVKVILCPSKMYPTPNHSFDMSMEAEFYLDRDNNIVRANDWDTMDFEDYLNSFSYYNCTNETGNRIHFYINN
jgi:hypothetical protein